MFCYKVVFKSENGKYYSTNALFHGKRSKYSTSYYKDREVFAPVDTELFVFLKLESAQRFAENRIGFEIWKCKCKSITEIYPMNLYNHSNISLRKDYWKHVFLSRSLSRSRKNNINDFLKNFHTLFYIENCASTPSLKFLKVIK